MSSDNYKHFLLLSPEELVLIIEKKDKKIQNIEETIKKIKEERYEINEYNNFHIEEISRLDKIIGEYRGS
jgi:hypothetical protein